MSLIDGRYEVIAERPLGGGCTLFYATAPDGTPLRIEWFDLTPGREVEFERYRRLLKHLKKLGKAALHDVVSRPGAHYVAWHTAPEGAVPARDPELARLLTEHGYAAESAELLKANGRSASVGLYGLTFGDEVAPQGLEAQEEGAPARPLRHVDEPPLKWLQRLSPTALSWSISGLLLLVAAVLAFGATRSGSVNRLVIVPDLVGQQAQPAADALNGLALAVEPVALASDLPAGTVLALEPPAGAELRPGRSVRLSYALPPGQAAPTEVPAVTGLQYPGAATRALQDAGLRVGEVAHVHAPQAAGTVVAQGAEAGRRFGSGAGVDLVVSLGPTEVQTFVPQLVGLELEEARRLAHVAGISDDRIFVDEVAATRGFAGQVLSQSLAPYLPVSAAGAVLRLIVQVGSAGGATAGAPDLVGLPLAEAQRVAGGWNVSVTSLANPGLPEGVVAQTPAPGETAEGNDLALLVNAHPVSLSLDGVRVVVREPQLREVAYAWTIFPGIRTQEAEVWATDIEGVRVQVAVEQVTGGEIFRGSWLTNAPGPVRLELYLAGAPYGQPLLVP
ncbi:MAG: PASTA domain-containing protein [Trueperaceae bacterium]